MAMTRVAAALSMSVLLAGCSAASPKADPGTAPPDPTSSSSSAPADPVASSPGRLGVHHDVGPKLSAAQIAAMTQARASVSDAAIMRQLADRAERISQELAAGSPAPAPGNIDPGSNRALGYALMIQFGWPADQWPALDALWRRESGWSQYADNQSSHAYGIPQSLPGSKMAVVGRDWQTNPSTQIRWGLAYIGERYGSPDRAWAHSQQTGWY